ncbi:MAG: tRNA uridine-5-carboxymethylaminomethyl(34) synthesis enzyme MnmG, partial [Spirochaetaceae bacterium]
KGREAGLVDEQRWERFLEKCEGIEEIGELAGKRRVGTRDGEEWRNYAGKTLLELFKVPEVELDRVLSLAEELKTYKREWIEHVALEAKYEGYIQRQQMQVERFHRLESMRIPEEFDYNGIEGISRESRQKLQEIRPVSVGQASRISGVRSSDIAVLMAALGRGR